MTGAPQPQPQSAKKAREAKEAEAWSDEVLKGWGGVGDDYIECFVRIRIMQIEISPSSFEN